MRRIHFPHIECSTSTSGMEIAVPETQEGGLVPDGYSMTTEDHIRATRPREDLLCLSIPFRRGRRCAYCGSRMPDEKYKCDNCGAPRLESE